MTLSLYSIFCPNMRLVWRCMVTGCQWRWNIDRKPNKSTHRPSKPLSAFSFFKPQTKESVNLTLFFGGHKKNSCFQHLCGTCILFTFFNWSLDTAFIFCCIWVMRNFSYISGLQNKYINLVNYVQITVQTQYIFLQWHKIND